MKHFKHYLEEASFSRINTHLKSDRPVGMMTAFRGTYTYQDNKKRNKKLMPNISIFVKGRVNKNNVA